jgi:hypothetical protein
MSDDAEREIISGIQTNTAKNKAVTPRDLRGHITTNYNFPATRGWVNSFMSGHLAELCKTKSAPQKAQCLEVPRGFPDETVQCLNEFVNDLPIEFIFNLNEMGISELEDRTSKSVIVPKSMSTQKIHHKINRNLKHLSVISCISAARENLTPYTMTSHDSLPVRENLKQRGVRFDTDLILKARSKPDINAKFFLDSICTVFLPSLNELRALEEFADQDEVLLMNNCPIHVMNEVLGLLRDARVITCFLIRLKSFSGLMFLFLEF